MPIHEYCNEDREDCTDVLFLVGEKIPSEIDGKRRMVSAPVIKFRGPFSGGSTPANVLHEFGPGLQVYEAGMDKDVARAKKARYAKQDKERKEFVAKELSGLDL